MARAAIASFDQFLTPLPVPPRHRRPSRKRAHPSSADDCQPVVEPHWEPARFYRPRDPEASPFFRIVRGHFDEFERVYPERFQLQYGFWRPIIRSSIDKFMKCGDLKEGFARVRCPECRKEFFVAFSCRQRSCCPSCDRKRSLLLAYRLMDTVLAAVPHRQWVFTIPKRLRVFFRYDRGLLGALCRAAYDTVRAVYRLENGGDQGMPAMVCAVQTFGNLINWHPHLHAIVPEGVFLDSGRFAYLPDVWHCRVVEIWQERVFDLLLDACRITPEVVASMRQWKHSGFSVDTSVRLEAGDHAAMERLIGYVTRCPVSMTRMVALANDDHVLYRASSPSCLPFPMTGDLWLSAGMPRNYELLDPLEFLAEVTQHIPNRGEHQIRYYGWYSNKKRGMVRRQSSPGFLPVPRRPDEPLLRQGRLTWAMLIKRVYEVDPLLCPNCGGTMKIIAFIEENVVIERILRHCGLWREAAPRPPPADAPPPSSDDHRSLDPGFFERTCA